MDLTAWRPRKIPQELHVYWEGPLPYLSLMTVVSFRRMNPDWTITLHTSSTPAPPPHWTTGEHSVPYTGPDYCETLVRAVDHCVTVDGGPYPVTVRADLCRARVLAGGGMWSDMDIIWRQSLNILPVPEDVDVATVFEHGYTGALLAAPGTSYFTAFRRLATERAMFGDYQSAGPHALLACGSTADDVARKFPGLVIAALPSSTFYPIRWSEDFLPLISEVVPLPSESVGVHWFGGSPIIERFLNAYHTPDDLRGVTNTVTATLRDLALL